jgi:integrase
MILVAAVALLLAAQRMAYGRFWQQGARALPVRRGRSMGSIFRKTFTRAVPATAERVRRGGKLVARWRGKGGKWIEGEIVANGDKEAVRVESGTYFAKYRNTDDQMVVVATGCRDDAMARQFLNRLERGVERVRAGVATGDEERRARHLSGPIADHIRDYLATLTGSEQHRKDTRRYLDELARELKWKTLADQRRDALELYLADRFRAGKSARSCNARRIAASGFCTWLVDAKRRSDNPFAKLPAYNEEADPRRPRRALTIQEVARLAEAARNAPERPPLKRRPKPGAKSARPAIKLSGPDRAVLYLVLAFTGLRVGELAKILVRDVRLDDEGCRIDLPAKVGKNRRQAKIPLRKDLVDAVLRPRIEGKPPTARVFDVPASLIQRFDADCKRAGIPKEDDRKRTVDIHSLRVSFNTWLAQAGVPPRIAQELMRHHDICITMNVYTDTALLDMSAAVESLPMLHQMLHQTNGSAVQSLSTDVNECEEGGKEEDAS